MMIMTKKKKEEFEMMTMMIPMIKAAGPSSHSGRAIWSQMGHTLGDTTNVLPPISTL